MPGPRVTFTEDEAVQPAVTPVQELAPQVDDETQNLANSMGYEVGNAATALAEGDSQQIKAQLAGLLSEAQRIISDAERLGIPHNVDISALTSAASTEVPSSLDLNNALKVSDAAKQLDAHVVQQSIVQGATDGLGALAGIGLMGGLAVAGHEAYKHLDGAIAGALPGMKHLVTGGMNNLENSFGALVTNYQGLPSEFVPQQGLPNLIGEMGRGIV